MPTKYVIYAKSEDGFWSKRQGWVGEADEATAFTQTATRKAGFRLPIAAGGDAQLLPLITKLRVRDLAIGDRVDLEKYPHWDTDEDGYSSGKAMASSEWVVVESLEFETPSCMLLTSEVANIGIGPDEIYPVKPLARRDREVLRLEGDKVVQWDAGKCQAITSDQTLEQFGVHNLTEREADRCGVDMPPG